MEKNNILIQAQRPNNLKSKFTIKLIGNANDLSEIVRDINSKCCLNSQLNRQPSIKSPNALNFKPSKKKLKMKEEILPQRVILVVPKDSPSHYPSSPKHENNLINVENQKRHSETGFEELKLNDQQNSESCAQNITEDKNENNLFMDNDKNINLKNTKLPNLNITHKEDTKNPKIGYQRFNHNHEAETIISQQMANSQHLFKPNEKKSSSFKPVFDRHKVHIIKRPFKYEEHISKPSKRRLSITENIAHSKTLTKKFKNNLQSIPDKNPAQESITSNGLTPLKILHSPIVLGRSHPTNYFQQNKLPNGEQMIPLDTDSISEKATEDATLSALSFGDLTETTNCSTGNHLINIATMNQSSENKKTYGPLFRRRNFNGKPNSLTIIRTTTKSSLPENENITFQNQEQSLKNTKIDIPLHNHFLNSNISESITESKSKIQQKVIPLSITNYENSKTIHPVLDNKDNNISQEPNNHECTESLETSEKKKNSVLLTLDQIIHEACSEKPYIKSPQIKVNGLMIRGPDPNLLNNLALKEKIQEFRLSNKPSEEMSTPSNTNTQHEYAEQCNNSVILPEVSESLVSTTTVESGQLDKKIRDCQCDQLRQEFDGLWEIITHLRSRIKGPLKANNYKCNSVEEESQSVDNEQISSMLLKELEEENRKITENLRKEQIRSNTLKITLKQKNNRIKQLENKIKTITKVFEETEQNAIYLRNLLNVKSKNDITSMIQKGNLYE